MGGTKFRAFFSPLPLPFSLFPLSLSGALIVELWWCLRVPAFKTPPKFNEKTPREREQKWGLERGKKSENLGGPAEGGGPAEEMEKIILFKSICRHPTYFQKKVKN